MDLAHAINTYIGHLRAAISFSLFPVCYQSHLSRSLPCAVISSNNSSLRINTFVSITRSTCNSRSHSSSPRPPPWSARRSPTCQAFHPAPPGPRSRTSAARAAPSRTSSASVSPRGCSARSRLRSRLIAALMILRVRLLASFPLDHASHRRLPNVFPQRP
jgi:hypothetical protein